MYALSKHLCLLSLNKEGYFSGPDEKRRLLRLLEYLSQLQCNSVADLGRFRCTTNVSCSYPTVDRHADRVFDRSREDREV